MARAREIDQVGERIEEILADLEGIADPRVRQRGEELVHSLLDLYGTGLRRVLEVLDAAEGGAEMITALARDPVIGGLLVLHDLHPQTTAERVRGALEQVRPYLGAHAGDVELLDIDAQGIVRLRLKGTCDGCPSSTVTVKQAIEAAIRDAAPEVVDIDVGGMVPDQAAPNGRPLLPLEAIECPVPR